MKAKMFIVFIIWAILSAVLWYFIMPVMSIGFYGGFAFISLGLIIITGVEGLILFEENDEFPFLRVPAVLVILFLIVSAIGTLASSAIFNSTTMYQQIGEFKNKSFKEDVLEIDTTQIPTVDIELAKKVADKKLGEEVALGSQCEVGEFTNKQQVNGKLVYVAPLEHRSFFKWNANKQGTTGYVVVSATNPNDVQLIREVNGEKLQLRYMNSAFFGDNLERHIKQSGFANVGLTEFSFELDDDGYPYWVVSTYRNMTAWGNPEATGVVVCDPQTGKCEWYAVKDAPQWVDIVQPEKFVKKQLANYGSLVHGWFNPSEKDELSVTEHMTTVYNEGDCYYYTGMSSSGADEGTVGFVMVNTRTKAVTYYKMVGATEAAAMRSAEGKVQDMGYKASNPIPLNISGIPAYFCTLKDSEGLIKGYAMLKIEDYGIVVTGNTIAETKRSFVNAVNADGGNIDFGGGDNVYGYEQTGIVTRIGSNIENGETYYYMILDDDESKLFLASYLVSEELPITREGDQVKISYVDESNGTINIVTFDNIKFAQPVSEGQQKINEEQEKNTIIKSDDTTITTVDPEKNEDAWESLSDEEKAKLLEKLEKEEQQEDGTE